MGHSILNLSRNVSTGDNPILNFTINTALDTSKPATFTLNLLSGKTRKAKTYINWGDGTTTVIPIETTTANKTAELNALCTHICNSGSI